MADVKIDDVQICRYLRLYGRAPGAALEARIREMREAADAVIRPARIWRRFEDVAIAGGAGSQSLAKHLEGCHAVYLVCATIGVAFDALQRRTAAVSASDAFVLQAIGAAAVEALMDDVELEIRSENAFEMSEGTLYPILHALEKEKMLESYWREVDGRKRKYYHITKRGKKELDTKKEEWKSFSTSVTKVLNYA